MITITGTKKIRGMLDLSGINKQLKAGDRLPLTDEDFSDHTVQLAINMGFVTYEQGGILDVSSKNNSIKLKNIYDRSIRINALDDEVRPGQTFTLTEDQVNSGDIRGALAKGMIEIVSSAKPVNKVDESNVRVGNIFGEVSEERAPETESSEIEDGRYLETNEEIFSPGVINDPNPKPVEKEDVPDPKGKTVIWNPTRDPLSHTKTKTQMEAVSMNNEGISESIESNVDISDITFVDEELQKERIQAHPILKDKPEGSGIDDGIDFL